MNVQHETAVTVHENLLPGNQKIWQCFATRYKIYSELRNFCKQLTLPIKIFCFSFFPDTFHKVLYTFHGQMEGDLSVAEGEVVRVCEKQNEDW